MKTNKCAYCKEIGHYINNCKHPAISILHNKIRKDAVIHMYSMIKHNFNYLLHKLSRLTPQEIRVLLYKNDYNSKIAISPSKTDLQLYYQYLDEVYSFINKEYINIPYIDNNELWNYASEIQCNTELQNILNIYIDIVKISPRPYCYDINMQYVESHTVIYDEYCAICFDSLQKNNVCTLNCHHNFCINCVKLYLIGLYKYQDDRNEYYPDCPLCRTYISCISIDDGESYVYFDETFCNRFIPGYFNKIMNNETIITHNYEKPFYYHIAPYEEVYEYDDVDSPYNHPILIHSHYHLYANLCKIIGYIINNIYERKLLQSWLFFIYIANFVLRHKEDIIELFYDFSPEH